MLILSRAVWMNGPFSPERQQLPAGRVSLQNHPPGPLVTRRQRLTSWHQNRVCERHVLGETVRSRWVCRAVRLSDSLNVTAASCGLLHAHPAHSAS